MSYRKAVVLYRDDLYQVTSYGNGAGYEILKLGTQGDTDWYQDDSADDWREEFDACDSVEARHELLGRYWADRD